MSLYPGLHLKFPMDIFPGGLFAVPPALATKTPSADTVIRDLIEVLYPQYTYILQTREYISADYGRSTI